MTVFQYIMTVVYGITSHVCYVMCINGVLMYFGEQGGQLHKKGKQTDRNGIFLLIVCLYIPPVKSQQERRTCLFLVLRDDYVPLLPSRCAVVHTLQSSTELGIRTFVFRIGLIVLNVTRAASLLHTMVTTGS